MRKRDEEFGIGRFLKGEGDRRRFTESGDRTDDEVDDICRGCECNQ